MATYTRRATGTPLEDTFYFTHDHLGSIDSVTNQSAVMQVRLSFDALGKRRNEAGWSGAVPSGDWTKIAATTRRGYTEHELIDNLTLTHMNGRVYDQTIGRFASADPFVQAPFYSQSLNRYAYVWNNPLTLIDPSGFGAQITISAEQIADEASRDSSGSGGANVLSISFGAYLWVTGGRIASGAAGSSDRPAITPNDDPKESPPSERIQQGRPTDAGIPMPTVRDSTVSGTIGPTSWRIDFFAFNPVGRAIARPFDLFAPFGTWIYGGEHVNPLSGEILSPRRQQDVDVLSLATGPAGIVRSTAARGTVTLYRAVSEAEALSIREIGAFSAGPNSLGGKWFAETVEDARRWGEALNGPGLSRILEVTLPKSIADKLLRLERLDGIGPARYGELDQLNEAVIREMLP